jgi:hypothetical protein
MPFSSTRHALFVWVGGGGDTIFAVGRFVGILVVGRYMGLFVGDAVGDAVGVHVRALNVPLVPHVAVPPPL